MPSDTTNESAFKNNINSVSIRRLGDALAVAAGRDVPGAGFDVDSFVRVAARGLAPLELKARVGRVADALERFLPEDFLAAAAIVDSLVDGLVRAGATADGGAGGAAPTVATGLPVEEPQVMGMWELWPVTDWVARRGRGHPDVALELLARLTPHSSGEFAVRPFIDDDPQTVLARFGEWVTRDDEHVRRLVSEGTRPRLPWAGRMAVAEADPGYARALLDVLVDDDSEYVRRSVSNHLNDLPKMDRDVALAVAGEWTDRAVAADASGDPVTAERLRWVVRRGIRTMVKAGDPDAMRLLGHDPDAAIEVRSFEVRTPVVELGSALELAVELASADDRPTSLVVDYGIHFLRANGTAGRKVFKWSTFDLAPGDSRTLAKSHSIKPITIRTYRPGRHVVDVQINGVVVATGEFELWIP